ncbi:PIPO, partial [Barley yellow mosaic virus]|uniref:PIPO n=1 Tax=Barley yellow mosaic virus TaxID=12465 RepID=UPI000264F5C1
SRRRLRTICLEPHRATFQDRIWAKWYILWRTCCYATRLKTLYLWYRTKRVFVGENQKALTVHNPRVDHAYAHRLFLVLSSRYPYLT